MKAPLTELETQLMVGLCTATMFMQMLVALTCTHTKRFSVQAYIGNCSWVCGIFLTAKTYNPIWLLLIPAVRVMFCFVYVYFGNIQEDITTMYLYNDFFENVTRKLKGSDFFTEGDYKGLVPFDNLDHSDANLKHANEWAHKVYESYAKNPKLIEPEDKSLNDDVMIKSQFGKQKWIIDNLGLTKDSRVLEMGFGKLDLMLYIRKATGATVEGTNLSQEQINRAKKNGFNAYLISHLDIHKHAKELGQYDLVISDGSLEYLVHNSSEYHETHSHKVFDHFIKEGICPLLKPGGRWFTTTLHVNLVPPSKSYAVCDSYVARKLNRIRNIYNLYVLSSGNEGGYPFAPDQMTNLAERHGLTIKLHQNRTIDYMLYSWSWMLLQIETWRKQSLLEKTITQLKHLACLWVAPNYFESYLCYTPNLFGAITGPFYIPWLWQFLRQEDGFTPVTHYWIVSEKPK